MTAQRSAAACGALASALAAVACGLGPGASVGDVQLTVTRDYGSKLILRSAERGAPESETAMRLLDRKAEISTRYGGGFVQSIDGLSGSAGGGRPSDWFFYVNGVESQVGAADYSLHGGDRVWWDYRAWGAAMRVPAVVGAFPEPFRDGYAGRRHPVRVRCVSAPAACGLARERVDRVVTGARSGGDPIRVLVGPWVRLRGDRAAALIERGPSYSGVFARFLRAGGSWRLQPLDAGGDPAGPTRSAGLVAATRDGDAPPTWVVTGSDAAATSAAARLLNAGDLRDRYAVAARSGQSLPLPAR